MMTPRRDDTWREQYLQVERSSYQLRKDLVAAFDQIHELKCDRKILKRWLRFLSAVIVAEGAIISWFATNLVNCMEAGRHAVALVLK